MKRELPDCPACGSGDVRFEGRTLKGALRGLVRNYDRFHCEECGHHWKEEVWEEGL